MNPRLKIAIGLLLALMLFLRPGHGFTSSEIRYHDYNSPHSYFLINALVSLVYLVAFITFAYGIFGLSRKNRTRVPNR